MQYTFENDVYSAQLLKRVDELNVIAMKHNKDFVDLEQVKRAIAFAKYYHADQPRKSGEPYYSHPIAVAGLALEHEFSLNIAIGALLHDVVEDNKDCTCEMICACHGFGIAEIVNSLTRIRYGQKVSIQYIVQEALKKGNYAVLLIKTLDRYHNMLTIEYMSAEKQIEIAKETLQYIVPIALYCNMFQMAFKLSIASNKLLQNHKSFMNNIRFSESADILLRSLVS